MEHLNQPYSEIMSMSTIERRYYLGLLLKDKAKRDAAAENTKTTGKGERTTRVGGEALKQQIIQGKLPI